MTHIDRLLKSSQNPRTRELLGAGLGDAPPRESLARVAAGLGMVAGGSTWSAVAAGAGAAASTASAAAAPGALSVLAAGKWLAIGALAGTLVSGAGVAIDRVSAPAPSASTPRAVTAATLDAAPRATVEQHAEVANASTDVAETPAPPPENVAPRSSAAAPRDSGALAAEVARIDAARSALSRGDGARALSELEAYRRERQIGVLDREAALLAIRAHSALGDTERARELSLRYLAAHPDDAHAPRLRELLDENSRAGDR